MKKNETEKKRSTGVHRPAQQLARNAQTAEHCRFACCLHKGRRKRSSRRIQRFPMRSRGERHHGDSETLWNPEEQVLSSTGVHRIENMEGMKYMTTVDSYELLPLQLIDCLASYFPLSKSPCQNQYSYCQYFTSIVFVSITIEDAF